MTKTSPSRYFKTSPESIGVAVVLCFNFPLSQQDEVFVKINREIHTLGERWVTKV